MTDGLILMHRPTLKRLNLSRLTVKRSYIYDLKRNIYEDKQGDCRYEIFLANTSQMMVIMPNEGVSLDDYATDFTSLEYTTLLDSVDVTKTAKAKIPEFSVSGDESAENITQIVEKAESIHHSRLTVQDTRI